MPGISGVSRIGSKDWSMLTEAQYQAENGSGWVLADGRSAVGSRYNAITGFTNIPDFRGMTERGKNHARADGFADPDGDVALGTQQASRNKDHDHDYADPGHTHPLNMFTATGGFAGFGPPAGSNLTAGTANNNGTGITFNPDGGGDARGNMLVGNIFFKMN